MAIKINFNGDTPEQPTLVLATKSGDKLGAIYPVTDVEITDRFGDTSELSFLVHKSVNGKRCALWDEIVDFKLVWCKEWDRWFSIEVKVEESNETTKSITAYGLGEYELSQIMLYDIEINTKDDILRDDYEPSKLCSSLYKDQSILHRLLSKAPHYSIAHVDSTIANLQRAFSFDSTSIKDAFDEIAEEIGCLFVYDVASSNGAPVRKISVYDLEDSCMDCGHRGTISGVCPECGGTNIHYGYGDDTAIYISTENLSDEITYETDVGSVKNCFRLRAGDDMMTAAVRSCNPAGGNYIWCITDENKKNMSDELRQKLNTYDQTSLYYEKEKVYLIKGSLLNNYNSIVDKYRAVRKELNRIPASITGFSTLMTCYFDVIDLGIMLQSGIINPIEMEEISAQQAARMLTSYALSPIAISSLSRATSEATIENSIRNIARTIIGAPMFNITVNTTSWENPDWTGTITVSSKTADDDTAVTGNLHIVITDEYEEYVKQVVTKRLAERDTTDYSISSVLKMDKTKLSNYLQYQSMDSLCDLLNACQSVLDILIESGASEASSPMYSELYTPYLEKSKLIQSYIDIRDHEIQIVSGRYSDDARGNSRLVDEGVQQAIESIIDEVHEALNLENYLGEDLWLELCAYRREDEYVNENYISDGLSNAEIILMALDFVNQAKRELFKSANNQHSISASLKNLLVMPGFDVIKEYFATGNWIWVRIDEKLFKLRLSEYTIAYSSIDEIHVSFSDVVKTMDGISDIESILSKASSLSSSFGYVKRQASSGSDASSLLDNWVENGLSVTNTKLISSASDQSMVWDEHGMLFRRLDPLSEQYDDIQLKIINSTIAITNDGWATSSAALGRFFYYDPTTGKYVEAYGINGETIVGKLILGEALGIYNSANSMSFDKNGLSISNGENTFVVNPNAQKLIDISHGDESILNVDNNGDLTIKGKITATTLDVGGADGIIFDGEKITLGNKVSISWSNVTDQPEIPDEVSPEYITQITKNSITSEFIKGLELEVGNQISMGANATISWKKVTDQPDIPDDDYITNITKNTITTEYVRLLKLKVGDEIEMGPNATISWSKVDGKPDVVEKDELIGYTKDNIISTNLLSWRKESATEIVYDTDSGFYKMSCAASWYGIYTSVEVSPNTTYTFSYDVMDGCGFNYSLTYSPTNLTSKGEFISESGKKAVTFTTSATQTYFNVYLYSTAEDVAYVRNVKLELGTRATQWTPNEIDAKIYTQITKDTIATTYIIANEVAAENITGTTISGKLISGGSISIGSNFSVDGNGNLNATNASLTGAITANSGTIGGLTVATAANSATHIYSSSIYTQSSFTETCWYNGGNNQRDFNVSVEFGIKPISGQTQLLMYAFKKSSYTSGWSNTTPCTRVFSLNGNGKIVCTGLAVYDSQMLSMEGDGTQGFVSDGEKPLLLNITDRVHIKWLWLDSDTDAICATEFSPDGDNTRTLGDSGCIWKALYSKNTYTSSDRKLKQDIESLTDGYVDFVMALDPVSYTFKSSDGGRRVLGFVAQDVAETAKRTVGDLAMFAADVVNDGKVVSKYVDGTPDENLRWSLNYNDFIAPLVLTAQKHNRDIESLEAEVARLATALETLRRGIRETSI